VQRTDKKSVNLFYAFFGVKSTNIRFSVRTESTVFPCLTDKHNWFSEKHSL